MAMTIQQQPSTSNVHGAFEQLMYVVTSTNQAAAFKFRYIADLYVGGILVSRVKVYPNASGAGVFRVDKLIQDWMAATKADQNVIVNEVYDKSIHNLGINSTTKLYSNNNGENYRKVGVKFGQEFAVNATTNPTVFPNVIPEVFISCIMSAGLRRPTTWDEGIPNYLSSNNWIDEYIPTSSTKKVFSDREINPYYTSTTASTSNVVHQDVTLQDVRTLGIAMDGSTPQSSVAVSAWIGLYNSSDVLIASGNVTAGTNGGIPPSSVSVDEGRLQYLGIGPFNLATQTVVSAINQAFAAGSVSYYEVFLMQDSSTVPSDATTSSIASCCYQYNVVSGDCMYGGDKFNFVTLAWQNSFGAWDYQSFNLLHQRSTGSIDRKTFEQVAGNWDTADSAQDFNYRGDQGGTRISKLSANQEMVANTDLFNEDEVDLLETLYISPNVFLIGASGSSITPVVITDTNFVRKTNLNERGPFTYQIKFKYAKERPTTKGGTFQGYS